jgi:hypothetical protein
MDGLGPSEPYAGSVNVDYIDLDITQITKKDFPGNCSQLPGQSSIQT